ncbi:hypothetical protein F4677DRAFT_440692 [Hypoxylon crocopeplum]|nr:hypothetical protein F4677DRAFT_440692 [Hypoxylon crocopeplum]
MDTKDISRDVNYLMIFDQIKENAELASRRKGENPQDYPPPHLLISKFMMKLDYVAARKGEEGYTISTSQVPPYYAPCIRPIQELEPLMISSMTLENHHRGTRVLIHILTPPDRVTAVMAIAEDEEGTAVGVQIYNQPDESRVSKYHILQAGDVCIIKEPFFKVTTEGSYSLRVDHVSDIIWLQDTDSRIPLEWRERILSLDETSHDIRMEGNAAVQERDWAEAERLYTHAIRIAETPEEEQLAHLNRSLCNLHLDRAEKALDDARKGNASENPSSEKALFREARALYSLGKFSLCSEKLIVLVRSNPSNSDAWTQIRRVKQRLKEEETGLYQFTSMYNQAEATPPLIDCATYVGSVAVRDSPGRGKGLFTTKPVKAGELLVCEKAFAYSYASDDDPVGLLNTTILMNLNSGTICMGGQANLITQIVQKLYHNPSGGKVFTDLYHGDYTPVATSEVDGVPVVDTFFVGKIIQLNGFGSPRTSYTSTMTINIDDNGDRIDGSDDYTTCGLWPLASRINHSCVANCRRSFIGDMQIVRACEDMEADTELYWGYRNLSPNETYDEVQKDLNNWGFACDCALCLDRKSTPQSTFQERKALWDSLKQLLTASASMAQLTRATKILASMEETYTARKDAPLIPHLELWDPYFALGARLIAKKKLVDGLEAIIKGFEALGYIIEACPPRDPGGGEDERKVTLEIKRWGSINEYTMEAFTQMMRVYKEIAPELCDVVKGYANIVYSICCGENETIGVCYPEFS